MGFELRTVLNKRLLGAAIVSFGEFQSGITKLRNEHPGCEFKSGSVFRTIEDQGITKFSEVVQEMTAIKDRKSKLSGVDRKNVKELFNHCIAEAKKKLADEGLNLQ